MVEGALRTVPEGVLVSIDVRPGARVTRVTGYNEWRGAISLDVAAAPERGAANREVERFLAEVAGPRASARVVRGAASRRKVVLVQGATMSGLAAALGAPSRG